MCVRTCTEPEMYLKMKDMHDSNSGMQYVP